MRRLIRTPIEGAAKTLQSESVLQDALTQQAGGHADHDFRRLVAGIHDLPAERLAAALHSRGLPSPPSPRASRESLVDRLVGGASASEMREAVRLSCNRADVD